MSVKTRIDMERLKADASCRHVAKYIGMRISGRYCECVSGLHKETQINHCAIYDDRIHCFSCGDSRDVIDMVRGYYANRLGSTLSYTEACKIVAESCGGIEGYMNRGYKKSKPMPFTQEELALVGLDQFSRMGNERLSPSAFFRKDEKAFMNEMKALIEGETGKIAQLLAELGNGSFESGLKSELRLRYNTLKVVYKRFGDKSPVRPLYKL